MAPPGVEDTGGGKFQGAVERKKKTNLERKDELGF